MYVIQYRSKKWVTQKNVVFAPYFCRFERFLLKIGMDVLWDIFDKISFVSAGFQKIVPRLSGIMGCGCTTEFTLVALWDGGKYRLSINVRTRNTNFTARFRFSIGHV